MFIRAVSLFFVSSVFCVEPSLCSIQEEQLNQTFVEYIESQSSQNKELDEQTRRAFYGINQYNDIISDDLVQELVNNELLFNQIDRLLAPLKEAEKNIISFWDHDYLKPVVLEHFSVQIPFFPKITAAVNKSSTCVELFYRMRETSHVITLGITGASVAALFAYGTTSLLGYHTQAQWIKKNTYEKLGISSAMNIVSLIGLADLLFQSNVSSHNIEAIDSFSATVPHGIRAAFAHADVTGFSRLLNCIQQRMIHCACYRKALGILEKMISDYPKLSTLQNRDSVSYIVCELPSEKSEFKKLLELLDTNTFKGKPSDLSWVGRVLVAYRLMHMYKDYFRAPLGVLAELDACMALARLYKEEQEKH